MLELFIKEEQLTGVKSFFNRIRVAFDLNPDHFEGINRDMFDRYNDQIQRLEQKGVIFAKTFIPYREWNMFQYLIQLPIVKEAHAASKVEWESNSSNPASEDASTKGSLLIQVGNRYLVHQTTDIVLTECREEATLFNKDTDPSGHLFAYEKDRLTRACLTFRVIHVTPGRSHLSVVS